MAINAIRLPEGKNELLKKVLPLINNNKEITTLWKVLNVNAIDRLGMSDHGPVHFQLVCNIALRLTRILVKHKVVMNTVKDYDLTIYHAELVVVLASLMHDLGMSINRDGHEEFSLFIANNLLREMLTFLPIEERVVVTSETLHAIISHRSGGRPITVEAGIVRVADALDMSEGRTRIPYEAGQVDIYSVSAHAVDNIEIKEGKDKPIDITINMNNTAGLFQVDELLKKKVRGSGIEEYLKIKAYVRGKSEKKLMKEYLLK
jgi:hypothetical protein